MSQRVAERLDAMSPGDLLGIYRALAVQHRKLKTKSREFINKVDIANVSLEDLVQLKEFGSRYSVQEVLMGRIEHSYVLRPRSFGAAIRESRESVRMA